MKDWLASVALGWVKGHWQTLLGWALARLQEGSTWGGIGLWLIAHGLLPDAADLKVALVKLGLTLAGFVAIVLKDKGILINQESQS